MAGLTSFLTAASISTALVTAIEKDVSELGAVDVRELRPEDWQALPTWTSLREMERRRILALC